MDPHRRSLMKYAMPILLMATVTGCAMLTETWRKPGATETETQAAQRECEAQAASVRAEPVPYGGRGVNLQPAELEGRARDAFNRCMQKNGYTLGHW